MMEVVSGVSGGLGEGRRGVEGLVGTLGGGKVWGGGKGCWGG